MKEKKQLSMVCVVIAQELRAMHEKLAREHQDTVQEMPCHKSLLTGGWPRIFSSSGCLTAGLFNNPEEGTHTTCSVKTMVLLFLSFPVPTRPLSALPSSAPVALPSGVPQLPTQDHTLDLPSSVTQHSPNSISNITPLVWFILRIFLRQPF